MSMRGRRPIAGMERTPSGALSRSKSNIAKRAEKIRQAEKEAQKREARVGRTLQERTVQARARVYGLSAAQAASHHASTIEGRLHLRGVITTVELLAIEHYKRVLLRFGREAGVPTVGANPLARYLPSEPIAAPKSSGAGSALAGRHYDAVEAALNKAGAAAVWAMSCVIRQGRELPDDHRPAFVAAARALVRHYSLGPDPDRQAQAA